MNNDLIYWLDEEDAQTVAMEVWGRKLSDHEMALLKDQIATHVKWFDSIADALLDIIQEAPKDPEA